MKTNNVCMAILALGLFALGAGAASCKQDPIFYRISTETAPKKPRIEGAPTNMVEFEREYLIDYPDNPGAPITVIVPALYVASGRLHWYTGKKQWDSSVYHIPQPAGKIISLAVTSKRLYALCIEGHGVNATLRYIGKDEANKEWIPVSSNADDYSLLQSIYADPAADRLFAGARKNNIKTESNAILYLDNDTDTLKTLQENTGIFSGAVSRKENGKDIYYLCTRGSGIFRVEEDSSEADKLIYVSRSLTGTLTISPADFAITDTEMTAAYGGTEEVDFQWYKDGVKIANATDEKYTPTNTGNYTVTATAKGYDSKWSGIVTVSPSALSALTGTVTISPVDLVTTGTEMTADYSGSEGVNYQWYKDGAKIANATGNKYTPQAAGNYTVIVNATGYHSTTSETVAVTNKESKQTFMGMIKLKDTNSTIVVIERNDGALYTVNPGSFERMYYNNEGNAITTGKFATGALALWEKPGEPNTKMLIAGVQGGLYSTTVSSYTHGYVEFVLNTEDPAAHTISIRYDPGKLQSAPDNDRYMASLGKHPINHLFQAPDYIDEDMTFFASTQTAGLWSYRDRGNKGPEWNAEE